MYAECVATSEESTLFRGCLLEILCPPDRRSRPASHNRARCWKAMGSRAAGLLQPIPLGLKASGFPLHRLLHQESSGEGQDLRAPASYITRWGCKVGARSVSMAPLDAPTIGHRRHIWPICHALARSACKARRRV